MRAGPLNQNVRDAESVGVAVADLTPAEIDAQQCAFDYEAVQCWRFNWSRYRGGRGPG